MSPRIRRIAAMTAADPSTPGERWRELFRTNDAGEALSILTSIAAMEFDARCAGACHAVAGADAGTDDADPDLGEPPYVVEVREEDWPDLREVLNSLREEQEEFEGEYNARQTRKRRCERWMMVVVALGALITMLLATLGCAAEDRSARHHVLRAAHA